jgi:YHS domain-containing protein
MTRNRVVLYLSVAMSLLVAVPLFGGETNSDGQKESPNTSSSAAKKSKTERLIVVNNTVCPVSGDTIGDDMGPGEKIVYKGHQLNLCCKKCIKQFNQDPDKYLKKAIDSAKKASPTAPAKTAKVKDLKNANCPVSGKDVKSMGSQTSIVYKGYKIALCCNGCRQKFNANPDSFLQALLNNSGSGTARKQSQNKS